MDKIKKTIKNNEKELYLGIVTSMYVGMYFLVFDIIDKYFENADFWGTLGIKFLFLLIVALGSLLIIADLENKSNKHH